MNSDNRQTMTFVSTVNGYGIRSAASSRFGQLFHVHGTTRAFKTLAQAESYASALTPNISSAKDGSK